MFGTDGIRDLWGKNPFNIDGLVKLSKAVAQFIKLHNLPPKVVMGGDTRVTTPIVLDIFSGVLPSYGIEVEKLGIIPTPSVAYLTKKKSYSLGIVVSASHNPFYYNGIKFFGSDGYKIPDSWEEEITQLYFEPGSFEESPVNELRYSKLSLIESLKKEYQEHVLSLWAGKQRMVKEKIVFDMAHGATYQVGESIFKELVGDAIFINNSPDGFNINENCGSTHLEVLKKEVFSQGASYGLAFDGDGDRVLVVDKEGKTLDGDFLLALFALYLKEKGLLRKNLVITTVMSNLGLELFLKKEKISMYRSKVGDRWVLQDMLQKGSVLGGEQSGHIILLDHTTTGDGILSAAFFLKVITEKPELLEKVKKELKIYPQILKNVQVKGEVKEKILDDPELKSLLEKENKRLGGRVRFLLRPSGTEHLFRVMAEGESMDDINNSVNKLVDYIEKNYGN